jgi:DNA polymerase-3 subunit gamma/tau
LPETIVSRTQRFTFNPVSAKVAARHLALIAKTEKINITEDALELLAEHGQGSFRDSISLLDQLSNTKDKITPESVRSLLGLPAESAVKELVEIIESGDSSKLLEHLDNIFSQGISAAAVARETSKQLRSRIISGDNARWIPKLLRELLEVTASAQPSESLEISLLEAVSANASSDKTATRYIPHDGETNQRQSTEKQQIKTPIKTLKTEVSASVILKSKLQKSNKKTGFDVKYWPEVVEYAKKHAASLYTALKLAKPDVEDEKLILYFQFPLHQKKLNQTYQKDIIGQIIEEVANTKVKIECIVNKEMFKNVKSVNAAEAPSEAVLDKDPGLSPVKNISNIFGSAEVLESN